MDQFFDHASLIIALGGGSEVAEGVDTLPVNVRAWVARNRIPPDHWPALIDFAGVRSISVTAEWLMRTTPARKRPSEPGISTEAVAA